MSRVRMHGAALAVGARSRSLKDLVKSLYMFMLCFSIIIIILLFFHYMYIVYIWHEA